MKYQFFVFVELGRFVLIVSFKKRIYCITGDFYEWENQKYTKFEIDYTRNKEDW